MHSCCADDSIQFDLPAYVPAQAAGVAEAAVGDLFSWLAPYMIYLFWGAVDIGRGDHPAARLPRGERYRLAPALAAERGSETEAEDAWRPDAGAAQVLLSEADALAARGDYDEAVHLLLAPQRRRHRRTACPISCARR